MVKHKEHFNVVRGSDVNLIHIYYKDSGNFLRILRYAILPKTEKCAYRNSGVLHGKDIRRCKSAAKEIINYH